MISNPAFLFTFLLFVAPVGAQTLIRSQSIEKRFVELRNSPPELYAFLLRMPKGADLHNHVAGAVYAETFLEQAAKDSLCIDPKAMAFTAPAKSAQTTNELNHCSTGEVDASQGEENSNLANAMIDSLSMRGFVPGKSSAHDHFFDTFDKFTVASHGRDGDYIVELVRRAAEQNESYLELMALGAGSAVSTLGQRVGLSDDFEVTRQKLLVAGLERQVEALRSRVDEMEKARIEKLGCEAQPDSPPCRVVVRYILQVLRAFPKQQVFAQTMAGFMLASVDPRVVAVNFVQPEDNFTAMRDYHLHMQMVAFAKQAYPKVHISLHAGELASGLVPPSGLRFHIREAIEIGHAERIGHGTAIMYELDSLDTLNRMRNEHIAVEINLTSNDLILGVKGKDHPFPIYRKFGVPVTLSTDDEGVSRTHLTQEYQRAVLTYNLTYSDLKQIVRNGLQYCFLPGASLWQDAGYRSRVAPCTTGWNNRGCKAFLATSEKAALQADLEKRFATFEHSLRTSPN